MLNEVTITSTVRSPFLSNTHGSTFEHHDISSFTDIQDILISRTMFMTCSWQGIVYCIHTQSDNFSWRLAVIKRAVWMNDMAGRVSVIDVKNDP